MKNTFMDSEFLLDTETARTLYHNYAERMPIFDYHNHLSAKDIAEHRRFFNLEERDEGVSRFSDKTVFELVRTAAELSKAKTGALIVIEHDTPLGEYERTGISLDAVVSTQLLVNIFEKNTPLHDGAVIIRDNRVVAATCYLPLTERGDVNKELGTRHRAGLGISENTDSMK